MEISRHAEKALAGLMTFVMCLSAMIVLVPTSKAEPVELGTSLTPLPAPRAFAGAAVGDDGRLYVVGGIDSSMSVESDTVIIYNTTTGSSTYGHKMQVGVYAAVCVKAASGKIYVVGGWNSTAGAVVATTQIYDPVLDSWTTGAPMPTAMYYGTATLGADGKIYAFGGWNSGPLDDTQIYDPVGNSWASGAAMPVKKWGLSSVTVGPNSIMVIGGGNYSSAATSRVDVYNPSSDSWSPAAPMNTPKCHAGAAMGRNGFAYSLGGSDSPGAFSAGTEYDTIERYDVAANSWELSSDTLSQARSAFGAAVDEFGRVFIAGGFTVALDALSSVEMFLPSTISPVNTLVIVSPTDGSTVSGTVAVQVIVDNGFGWNYLGVDLLVDGVVTETQVTATSWTFLWDASALSDQSSHTLTARGYLFSGAVSEDTITVTVASQSVEDTVAAIEQQLADIQTHLADLQAQLAIQNVSLAALSVQASMLQAQLTGLQLGLVAMATGQAAAMAQLNVTIAGLLQQLADFQTQLDNFQTQIDRVENKADNAGMIGIVTVVLVVIVLVLLALMFMAMRKKE